MREIQYSTVLVRPMSRDESIPAARDDVAFAREQGAWAFLPSMLPDKQASSKCCCYQNPLYREAFHYGFMQAALEYLEELMHGVANELRTPFMKVVTRWHGTMTVPMTSELETRERG